MAEGGWALAPTMQSIRLNNDAAFLANAELHYDKGPEIQDLERDRARLDVQATTLVQGDMLGARRIR